VNTGLAAVQLRPFRDSIRTAGLFTSGHLAKCSFLLCGLGTWLSQGTWYPFSPQYATLSTKSGARVWVQQVAWLRGVI